MAELSEHADETLRLLQQEQIAEREARRTRRAADVTASGDGGTHTPSEGVTDVPNVSVEAYSPAAEEAEYFANLLSEEELDETAGTGTTDKPPPKGRASTRSSSKQSSSPKPPPKPSATQKTDTQTSTPDTDDDVLPLKWVGRILPSRLWAICVRKTYWAW
jgi:hypothetical protein